MPRNPHPEVDEIDRRLLDELQNDGRASVAHLARVVNLSSSATADRVRRLTDIGVITGYSVTVDTESLGYTVTAFVRLAYPSGNYGPFDALVASTPEIIEAHHVTGDDCFIIKVLAARCGISNASPAGSPPSAPSPPTSCTRAPFRVVASLLRDGLFSFARRQGLHQQIEPEANIRRYASSPVGRTARIGKLQTWTLRGN